MSEKWRYENLIESTVKTLKLNRYWTDNDEAENLLYEFVSHIITKAFYIGRDSDKKNSLLTDLSNYPEIYDKIKHRWKEGISN